MNNISVELFDLRSKSDNQNVYVLTQTADAFKVTFNHFKKRCLSQAKFLELEGINRTTRVLCVIPDHIETAGLFHALTRLGAQMFFVHHDIDVEDLAEICNLCQIEVIIGDSKSIFQIKSVEKIYALFDVLDFRYPELEESYNYQDDDFAVGFVTKKSHEYFELTSFTHGELVAAMNDMDQVFQFDADSQVLNTALPVCHPLGLMINAIAPFRYHGTHYLFKFYAEISAMNRYINQHKINVFFGNPYTIDIMLNHSRTELSHRPDKFYVTGERLPTCLWKMCQEKYQITPINLFSVSSSLLPLFNHAGSDPTQLGAPSNNIEVELSTEGILKFRTIGSDTWQQTSDIVVVDDQAHYRYICRQEFYQKIGDSIINCLDIEDRLLTHDDVEDCQVRFDQQAQLIGNVVLKPGRQLSELDLCAFINHNAQWHFVEEIPRTLMKKKT